jgi:lysophospholipase L1-like esterase
MLLKPFVTSLPMVRGLGMALRQHRDANVRHLRVLCGGNAFRFAGSGYNETTYATVSYKTTFPCRQRYVRGIKLALVNFEWENVNFSEIASAYTPVVKASVLVPNVSTTPILFKWGGASTVTLPAQGYVVSDLLPEANFVQGETIEIRLFVDRGAQAGFWTPDYSDPGSNLYYKENVDNTLSLSPNWSQNRRVVAPALVLGNTGGEIAFPVVGCLGDSIAITMREGVRAAGLIDIAAHTYSDRANGYADPAKSAIRRIGMECCTHLLLNLGHNDLIGSGLSANTLKTNIQKIAKYFANGGIQVYVATVTPRTNSTDGWTTVGNQTVYNSAREAERVIYNDWLRDTSANGALVESGGAIAGVIEIADVMETGRNTGIFKANYTNDGVHPFGTGYTAMKDAYAAFAGNFQVI